MMGQKANLKIAKTLHCLGDVRKFTGKKYCHRLLQRTYLWKINVRSCVASGYHEDFRRFLFECYIFVKIALSVH